MINIESIQRRHRLDDNEDYREKWSHEELETAFNDAHGDRAELLDMIQELEQQL